MDPVREFSPPRPKLHEAAAASQQPQRLQVAQDGSLRGGGGGNRSDGFGLRALAGVYLLLEVFVGRIAVLGVVDLLPENAVRQDALLRLTRQPCDQRGRRHRRKDGRADRPPRETAESPFVAESSLSSSRRNWAALRSHNVTCRRSGLARRRHAQA